MPMNISHQALSSLPEDFPAEEKILIQFLKTIALLCVRITNFYKWEDYTHECNVYLIISRVQMKSWAGTALETVNCFAFLKRKLIG
jgi:hypothetical protein